MKEFFDKFAEVLRKSRILVLATVSKQLHTVNNASSDIEEQHYSKLLTAFAFRNLFPYLSSYKSVAIKVQRDDSTFAVVTSSGLKNVTDKSCECHFFKTMGLPCKHILKIRSASKLNIFDKDLCPRRWHTTFLQEIYALQTAENLPDNVWETVNSIVQLRHQNPKYKAIKEFCDELVETMPNLSNQKVLERLKATKDEWDLEMSGVDKITKLNNVNDLLRQEVAGKGKPTDL